MMDIYTVITLLVDNNFIDSSNIPICAVNKHIYHYFTTVKSIQYMFYINPIFIEILGQRGLDIILDNNIVSVKFEAEIKEEIYVYHDGSMVIFNTKEYTYDILIMCKYIAKLSYDKSSTNLYNPISCLEMIYLLNDIVVQYDGNEDFIEYWRAVNSYKRGLGTATSVDNRGRIITMFRRNQPYLYLALYKYMSICVWNFPIDKPMSEYEVYLMANYMLYNRIYFKGHTISNGIIFDNIEKILFQLHLLTCDINYLRILCDIRIAGFSRRYVYSGRTYIYYEDIDGEYSIISETRTDRCSHLPDFINYGPSTDLNLSKSMIKFADFDKFTGLH